MNAAGKSGLGFIFDERDNKNILLFTLIPQHYYKLNFLST